MTPTAAELLRRAGFKNAVILAVNGKPPGEEKPKAKASDSWPGFRSKWESMFAVVLDQKVADGDIVEWKYEPITFRLTEQSVVDGKKVRAVRYTPDFVCWLPSGKLRCVEIKGRRRIEAINRFKVAKDKFRNIEWLMVTREGGTWKQLAY